MIRKLYSSRETILGSLIYPDEWEREIVERGHYRLAFMPIAERSFSYRGEPHISSSTIRTFVLHIPWVDRHGILLAGCTPEEFEKVPRCGFIPGAAYIRSLVT